MDDNIKQRGNLNPIVHANLLSKLTFFFTYPTFKEGLKKDLTEENIYEILNKFKSTKLGNRIENEWCKEKEKEKPAVLVPLLKIFGLEYICLGLVLAIINTSLIIATPLLIGKVVSYFNLNATMTQEHVIYYSAVLTFSFFGSIFFLHNYMFKIQQLAMKVKISCCTLFYRKCLKLNLSVTPNVVNGQIITLMTKDVNVFDLAIHFSHQFWIGTIQTIIMTYIMYREIGIAALIGTGMLLILVPIQVYLGKKAAELRLKTLSNTDHRVRITQEILTAIRIIKIYTWELFFQKSINSLRKKEIDSQRNLFYIKAFGLTLGQLSSRLAFYMCIMAYVAMDNNITAEKAFVVIGCFAALKSVITVFMPLGIAQIAELKASLQRITQFLLLEELHEESNVGVVDKNEIKIVMENVTVMAEKDSILEDLNLTITSGVTAIIGYVGAGKSTLLRLILGDIKKYEGKIQISGKISYASQEPWLFSGTIKQNIIFSEKFDEERYLKIIQVCALKKDFSSFPNRDRTCVTDKGLNLSRGQKTRINLARAIYRKADIYLLDDCLSSVDSNVGKHIFYECLKFFLKDKICIFVTNQNELLKESNEVVILNEKRVEFQGDYSEIEENIKNFQFILDSEHNQCEYVGEVEENQLNNNSEDANEDSALLKSNPKLVENVYKETKEEGAVSKDVYYKYFTHGGGLTIMLVVLFFSIMAQVTASWSDYFVSYWVNMEQDLAEFKINQTTNSTEYQHLENVHGNILKQYSFIIIAAAIFALLRAFSFFWYFSKVSINIHSSIIDKVFNAGMIFFDTNLSGNILNRFSRDLGILDEQLPYIVFEVTRVALMVLGALFVISSVNFFFIIPSIIFAILLIVTRNLYLPTARSIQRLEGSTRSPIIGHLTATLEGLPTIRASQAQNILKHEFDRHQDFYNSVSFMNLATSRAFGFYLDVLCTIFISIITFSFIFITKDAHAGAVGLAITQSYQLTGLLQWGVRQWAELENKMTSAERVLEYAKIETEESGQEKPTNWPKDAKIVYENVTLSYSPQSERVLKEISFVIEPKEKIGIVGRTGAGKSSIVSTLLKLYNFKGLVTIDGLNLSNINNCWLRSKISVIPQDPVLFSGTVRDNLDPNREFDDQVLWDALEEVEMKVLIENLHSAVSEGGSNYSVGERQLICLARAIIRKNTILILDEATANIDPQTDTLIQKTIKIRFSDCTIITIAHRLNTIMHSDKVLVMDLGRAIEYDTPKELLNNKEGKFYKMVKDAGL